MTTTLWFELTAVLTLARRILTTQTAAPALVCRTGIHPRLVASPNQPETAVPPVAADPDTPAGTPQPPPNLSIPLTVTGPDGTALIDRLCRASASGAAWVSVDVSTPEPIVAFHTDPPRTDPTDPEWTPALVAIDDLLGPYPTQVRVGRTWNGWAIPRFTREVAARIAADTQRLASDSLSGPVEMVYVVGDQVRITHHSDNEELVEPDQDGMYGVGAGAWTWSVVDDTAADCIDDCQCGAGCGCPATCAVCIEPVDAGHATACPWRAGSAVYEQPVIPPQPAVLDAHRHRPGCPLVRRRPGPLFDTDDDGCAFCGAVDGRDLHTLHRNDGTLEHHQRCTTCGHTWSATGARAA